MLGKFEELLVILVVVLVLFGGRSLPRWARSLFGTKSEGKK
jgi:Sec-independent protein translocase protein TatA